MAELDPRTHAYRPDLADAALQAHVKAARYVEPVLRQCTRGVLPLLAQPDKNARRVSEIRCGEFLDVFEQRENGFAWVQNRNDRYVGYLPALEGLSEEIAALSNRVRALHTFVYPEPDLKAPPVDRLTLGSYVRVLGQAGAFLELASGGYVFAAHVAPTEETLNPDYVFTAGRLLGVPYLWGGRTPLGIDCSGLVQLALEMAGIDAPRDSDQQREAFGHPLDIHWRDMVWKRGDIVFMQDEKGAPHVGLMANADHLLHATAAYMQVAVEPLAEVVGRGVEVVGVGRV